MTVIKDDQALLLWDTVLPIHRRQGFGSMMLQKTGAMQIKWYKRSLHSGSFIV